MRLWDMRFKQQPAAPVSGFDLTPMIDVTFQLIIFFMLLVNFDQTEQDQRVNLPVSELAEPPEDPYENALTIQLTKDGVILFGGEELSSIDQLQSKLRLETQVIQAYEDQRIEDTTIIIRADSTAKTGLVQEMVQAAQNVGFRHFALRGEQGRVRVEDDRTVDRRP